MGKLIDLDDLEKIEARGTLPYLAGIRTILRYAEDLPDASKPSGRWVRQGVIGTPYVTGPICSRCGFGNKIETPYCPHCGAKMAR